jgi:hypothetical protein
MRLAWLAGLGLCLASVAQGPPSPWQWQPLPDLKVAALGLGYAAGVDTDAVRGLSLVLAELRLQAARAAVPGVLASGVAVGRRSSAVWVVVESWALGAQFLAAFAAPVVPSDDALALQTARAALAADDAAWLYPGEALRALGAVAWFGGTAAEHGRRGTAAALAGAPPAQVRAGLGPLAVAAGLAVGRLPEAGPGAVAGLPVAVGWPAPGRLELGWPEAGRPEGGSALQIAPPSEPVLRHPRADGPYAALAFAVPPELERTALALGLEVARARAAVLLPPQKGEAAARLQRIAWDWPDADPLVVCARRGPNRAELAVARAELQRCLADLRQRPPAAAEVAAAAVALGAEMGLWPWSAGEQAWLGTVPETLGRRLTHHLLAATPLPHRDALAAVPVAAVARALQGLFAGAPRAVAVVPGGTSPAPQGLPGSAPTRGGR